MPIPNFRADGWLPEGHHKASWEEVVERFRGDVGGNRAQVMQDLLTWRDRARQRGISGRLILNGGFISARANPKDFDAILIYDDGVESILEDNPEAKSLVDYRICKEVGFDLFVFSAEAARKFPNWARTDAFDYDKLGSQKEF